MAQFDNKNRVLYWPSGQKGEPDNSTVRLETVDVPTPKQGQMQLRNENLSLGP